MQEKSNEQDKKNEFQVIMDHNQLKARLLAKPDVFQQNTFRSLRPNFERNKKVNVFIFPTM